MRRRNGRTKRASHSLLGRIAVDRHILHGKPRIRHTRIPVSMVLELLAAGQTAQTICRDFYPDLRPEDVRASVAFANQLLTGDSRFRDEPLRATS